jgi:hypothetical protein
MPSLRSPAALFIVLAICSRELPADDYTLSRAEGLPTGISAAIGEQLNPQGYAIKGPQRGYATLWLVKAASLPADFKPSAAIRYPFTPGQLIGVVDVPKRAKFQDFRGNELDDGTYTLRYGQQPMDGNHIGTSDLADFLVAIPADQDEDPAIISDLDQLMKLSAEASGTTHPAIFSLQPVEKSQDEPSLFHDEPREFWILQANTNGQSGKDSKPLPVRLVIVGVTEG